MHEIIRPASLNIIAILDNRNLSQLNVDKSGVAA
jgi:hypothetical protein